MQISKGGKQIYGWVQIGPGGRLTIPEEIAKDYGFRSECRLLVVPGSKTSGGFSVSSPSLLRSPAVKKPIPLVSGSGSDSGFDCGADRGALDPDSEVPFSWKGRPLLWVRHSRDGTIRLLNEMMAYLGIVEGDRLLGIRGSGLAAMFALKGPIVKRALAHPEIPVLG